MTHEQRWGHSIGVDKAGIGTLQSKRQSRSLAQSRMLVSNVRVYEWYVVLALSLTIIPSVRKRIAPPRAWRMKKVAGRAQSLAVLQQTNTLP